jgi:Tfp pilus assembly protein PilO
MSLWRRVYEERRAIMLPLLVLIALDAAVLAIGVFPLSRVVGGLEADAQNANTNLLKARVFEKQTRDAVSSRSRADEELTRFYVDILPANASAARKVFSVLQQTAATSGLRFQRSTYDETEVQGSRLIRMTQKVTLLGDYAGFRKFLYAAETAPEFVVIERVALSEAGDTRSANSAQLDVTLDVATYFLAAGQ